MAGDPGLQVGLARADLYDAMTAEHVRVRRGADLYDAMTAEHGERRGPTKLRMAFGRWYPDDDLAVWYC